MDVKGLLKVLKDYTGLNPVKLEIMTDEGAIYAQIQSIETTPVARCLCPNCDCKEGLITVILKGYQ